METWAQLGPEETRVTLAPTAQLAQLARDVDREREEILAQTAQRVQREHSVGAVKQVTLVHVETPE